MLRDFLPYWNKGPVGRLAARVEVLPVWLLLLLGWSLYHLFSRLSGRNYRRHGMIPLELVAAGASETEKDVCRIIWLLVTLGTLVACSIWRHGL